MDQIYFQQQTLRRCGLHAVNNLLGKEEYTEQQFSEISKLLKSQTNQDHQSLLSLGNYDYNVIETALDQKQYTLEWLKAKQIVDQDFDKENLHGFLINEVKNKGILEQLFDWDPKHWIAIRVLGKNQIYLLDSKKKGPIKQNIEQAKNYLNIILLNKENNVIFVIKNKQ